MIAEPVPPQVDPIGPENFAQDFLNDPAACLGQLSTEHLGDIGPLYFLIYADDGVIWGRVEQRRLRPLKGERVPALRAATLQQCRVFGEPGELLVWREAEGHWRGRVLLENGSSYETLDERQMLWGLAGEVSPATNAVRLVEPGLGFQQTVPAPPWQPQGKDRRVYLTVRHYLAPDDSDGQAVITHTRLLNLTWEAEDASTA